MLRSLRQGISCTIATHTVPVSPAKRQTADTSVSTYHFRTPARRIAPQTSPSEPRRQSRHLIEQGLPSARRRGARAPTASISRRGGRRPSSTASGRWLRHQMVYATLGELMGREIHALSLSTLTPEEQAGVDGRRRSTLYHEDTQTWTKLLITGGRPLEQASPHFRRQERHPADPARHPAGRTAPDDHRQRAASARCHHHDRAAGPHGCGRHHRRTHAHRRGPATTTRFQRALRTGQDHACVDPGAGPAGGALRRSRRLAARRLRDRLAPGEPAYRRPRGAWVPRSRSRTATSARKAEPSERRAHLHGYGHRHRHREHHDGRGARPGHDRDRERGAGTRSGRPGHCPESDGRQGARHGHRHDRHRRRQEAARHRVRRAA